MTDTLRTMTSVDFRRHYARLTEPTIVTALGRPIGYWTPAVFVDERSAPGHAPASPPAHRQPGDGDLPGEGGQAEAPAPPGGASKPQAARDRILRKANRGGK